jgi:hypothetical protein
MAGRAGSPAAPARIAFERAKEPLDSGQPDREQHGKRERQAAVDLEPGANLTEQGEKQRLAEQCGSRCVLAAIEPAVEHPDEGQRGSGERDGEQEKEQPAWANGGHCAEQQQDQPQPAECGHDGGADHQTAVG